MQLSSGRSLWEENFYFPTEKKNKIKLLNYFTFFYVH